MDLEDQLPAFWRRRNVDVGFFADADLIAKTVDCVASTMRVQCEIVETTVSETIAVICRSSACDLEVHLLADQRLVHFAFLTFAISPTLASAEMHL